MEKTWIGIDVAKGKVTVFDSSTGEVRDVTQPKGLRSLVRELSKLANAHVVMESTGGYERNLQRLLHDSAIDCTVLNPARARYFMKSLGRHAKSDPIDAQLLALYGQRMEPEATTAPSKALEELGQLVSRRKQLVGMLAMEANHGEHVEHQMVQRSLKQMKRVLEKEISKLDEAIARHVEADEGLAQRSNRMQTVKGIGPVVSAGLLWHVPELGTLSKAQAASLVGLAPYVVESGTYVGKRRIRGGRSEARRLLYLAAVVAMRWNPPLKAVYERLVASGKAKKVALTAIARKLIVILNSLLKKGEDWDPYGACG